MANKDYTRDIARKKEKRLDFYEGKKCLRCGTQKNLGLHHRIPRKDYTFSQALNWGWGRDRLQAELSLCDVLCASCHTKTHWEMGSIKRVRRAQCGTRARYGYGCRCWSCVQANTHRISAGEAKNIKHLVPHFNNWVAVSNGN